MEPAVSENTSAVASERALSPQLYARIAQQPFFQGLKPHHFQLLTDSAMETQFEPEQRIFREGDAANRFYIILEGKVLLEAEGKERGMIPIQTLGPGDCLGWSWLSLRYYLHFSARTLEPTRALFFYGTRLRKQCEQDHDLGYELMKRIAEILVQRLQATQQNLVECAGATDFSG